jgi:hypothetical protein
MKEKILAKKLNTLIPSISEVAETAKGEISETFRPLDDYDLSLSNADQMFPSDYSVAHSRTFLRTGSRASALCN